MPVDPLTGAPLPYPGDPGFGGQPGPGGLPPELAAMLGGGSPPPQGPPPQQEQTDSVGLIRQAIDAAQLALEAEPDDVDSGELAKAIGVLYKILGNRQKEQEAALGGNAATKFLGRAG